MSRAVACLLAVLIGVGAPQQAAEVSGARAHGWTSTSGGQVCFGSQYGPVCVARSMGEVGGAGGEAPEEAAVALMETLLRGPSRSEIAQGLYTAIPFGTELITVDVAADQFIVRLDVPPERLAHLDSVLVEEIVEQVGWTLAPLGWRDLQILALDPRTREYKAISEYLPELPDPRKPVLPGEGPVDPGMSTMLAGEDPRQPHGALTGKTVYVSAGHGWLWSGGAWRVQRIPYPRPPYVGPIIEDFNNAEAVNQYLVQYLWNAGARVYPVRERDMNAFEAIADNDGSSPQASYSETGTWATVAFTDTGYGGKSYRWAATVTGPATAAATWMATLVEGGNYAVYVWYRAGANRAPDARYTVYHAGGETTLTVNQQRHGDTWHYLGTFGFLAGEQVRVVLDNRSAFADTVVVADAMRVGGGTFSSLTGIVTGTTVISGEPWWDMAALYQTQRMGMDPGPYFNDIVARPMYARWEHAGTGEDAVYVSWHTNGYNGYQTIVRGTASFIHNGGGKPVTPGSAVLRDAIHNELVSDIRATVDPSWPGGTYSKDLGELRELWDSDPSVRMPGALIEIAYHDHPADTDLLKRPSFEQLAARAVTQGIIRYFEIRDGVDLTLPPEPPTHLMLFNEGWGGLRVSWRPPVASTVGLGGDPPTGYRVYTSTNGVGWSHGVPVTGGTEFLLEGLPQGQLVFVRVASTNTGGESFPTEILAARVGDLAGVLVVSGFDRLDPDMLVPEIYAPLGETHMRMLLNRMNAYNYVIHHGEAIEYPFDGVSNEAVSAGLVDLRDYSVVDWILGEEWGVLQALDAVERQALSSYLDAGGALFISGSELGYDLVARGVDPAFYGSVLRTTYVSDDAGTYAVAPTSGGIFAGLGTIHFDALGEYDADFPDRIAPVNGSSAALAYQGGLGGTAAIQYAEGCRRIVHFGFPFETIRPEMRAAVMSRVMGFLDECLVARPRTAITSPRTGAYAVNSIPSFEGAATGVGGIDRVEVSLRRGADGAYWNGAVWGAVQWHTATGNELWSFPMPSTLSLGRYTASARAWDSAGMSDTTPALVDFAVVLPTAYLPLVLRSSVSRVQDCVDLAVNGGFEAEGGWDLVNEAGYEAALRYAGARSMRVGIPVGQTNPYTDPLYSSVAQTVTLPAGRAITLSYREFPLCESNDP
ncbi:MAG: hypothetical protein GX620_03765, partial [Chloroflexi bacterium]|nr:hypothetical protein [Chloroflexota bacterium]